MRDSTFNALMPRRILVALDTSARGRSALQAALHLALRNSAELQGLFVEDEDLVRLASLPFAREVELTSAAPRALQTTRMERSLRAAAEEAAESFANALADVDIQWTFRVVRGSVMQASLAAAGNVDLLVIGQQGRSPNVIGREYFVKQPDNGRVLAIFDGSQSAFRTLEIASSLAEASPYPLSVLELSSESDNATEDCLAWLQQNDVRADVDQILNPTDDALVEFIQKWPPSALLINRDSPFASEMTIRWLVDELDEPVILC